MSSVKAAQYTTQAGSTMLILIVASWVTIPKLSIITVIPTCPKSMYKKSFKHYFLMFSTIYQNLNKMRIGFPPTSVQISSLSGSSDWF